MAAPSTAVWEGRLEVGERVDPDIADEHRSGDVGEAGTHVHTGPLEQPGGEAEADRAVVVSAGQHDLRPGVDEPEQRLGEERDGVGGGERTVVDVAADQHGGHRLRPHRVDEVVEEGGLGAQEPDTVEGATQVPVGGVEEPHGIHARRAPRHFR
jgi:hypothetical protein